MGRGDQYQKPSFSVPMAGKGDWPFAPKPVRPHCEKCDRPADFCECPKEEK